MKDEFTRALGRRKEAVARVRLIPNGQGEILINNKKLDEYFPYFELKNKVTGPLDIVGKRTSFDFSVKVNGGGKSGQAAAVGLGIARALIEFNEEYRPSLRSHGYLTRDPRAKERKKFGLKRARRAPQWSKR
ncbi:MAG TPA: 30S ribosomal protein S9 [bacterium]|nr:30S ribosomal protein S9 [bacterium]HPL95439.1 30S ribosomal protein S9 [bacterium]